MRSFAAIAFFLASLTPASADKYTVQMPPSSAVVFFNFAILTRSVELDLPVGEHTILVPLDRADFSAEGLSVRAGPGVRIASFRAVEAIDFDARALFSAEQSQAFDTVKALKDALAAKSAEMARAEARSAALDAQRDFLASVTGAEMNLPDPQEMLRVSRAIRNESEAAALAEIDLRQPLSVLREEIADLKAELAAANRHFAALNPPVSPSSGLAISVIVDTPGRKRFELTERGAEAIWRLSYEIRLDEGDTPQVTLSRKVQILQYSGEEWRDIDLVLSTARTDATDPATVRPSLARIETPEPDDLDSRGLVDGIFEPEVIVMAEPAMMVMSPVGGAVQAFASPTKVTIGSGDVGLILDMGEITYPAELFFETSPRSDETAFVITEFTNNSDEHILPANTVVYRGAQLVGEASIDMTLIGETTRIGFGPEYGVRVTHDFLRRETGDRGLVSVSNTREEEVEFTLENLTDTPRTVRALYALPFSEQEELLIRTVAMPEPSETDFENGRGVSLWVIELQPGEKQTVTLQHSLRWPDAQDLYWRP